MSSDIPSAVLRPPARHSGLRGFLGVHPALVGAAVALAFVPRYANTYWTFSVTVGLVLAISCLGLLVLVGWAREISLMQAGLAGSALYVCQYAAQPTADGLGLGFSFQAAVALGIGFAAVVSLVTALVAVRLAGPYVIVLTLAVQYWLENLMNSERLSPGLAHFTSARPDFFGVDMWRDERFYYLVLGALFVVMGLLHRARNSRFGRSMILAGTDPAAAACSGVSPWRCRVWAFVVAGACAGLAGALSGPLYISPPGSLYYISWNSILYLAVPVLAGFDSIAGVVAVAVGFTLVPLLLHESILIYLVGGLGMAAGCFLGPRGIAGPIADRFGGHAT